MTGAQPCVDQEYFLGEGGGMGIQLQTRGGPTNFTIAKTCILENRGGVPLETRIVPAGVLS